jgi:hypothetical protein
VRVLDGKTWRSRVKWRAPNKYDIAKLLLAPPSVSAAVSGSPLPLYIAGRDNEVLLCNVPVQISHQQRGAGGNGEGHPMRKKMRLDKAVADTGAAGKAGGEAVTLHHTELPSASKLRMSHHR